MAPNRQKLMKVYKRLRARFGYRHWWPGDTPLEIMLGAILTQNTAWTNVEKALGNLKQAHALDVDKLLGMPHARLAALLRPSGYFNIKAGRLKDYLRFYRSRYGGNAGTMASRPLPALREELLAVRGIGQETADSILLYALNKAVFVVDAYTKRIFSRVGWFSPRAKYEEVQGFFTERLARDRRLYNDYHAQIVELGKEICRPKPRCPVCPIRSLCARRGV